MQLKFWDGRAWLDVTATEADALINERGDRGLFVCPNIDGSGALDPICVITTEKSV